MVLVNTDYISGKELEMLGMVKGSTIQCKNIGRDIGASFKNLVGGEMKAYTEMMNEARDLAIQRMVEEAEGLGADAVVNIRFATSAIIQGAAEVTIPIVFDHTGQAQAVGQTLFEGIDKVLEGTLAQHINAVHHHIHGIGDQNFRV